MTTGNTETAQGQQKPARVNGQQKGKQPRVLTNPNDIAQLVMRQIDAVNGKKDDLTIAVKGLADTTKQLARAYGQQAAVIEKLARRVKDLEEKNKDK
jgi:hypothetical protein